MERRGHNTITCGVGMVGSRASVPSMALPTLDGKIEYESLMRAISAPLPYPGSLTAAHSTQPSLYNVSTIRCSGGPSFDFLHMIFMFT